jgi:colanic acid/amylovoran biosynthesis glycosyltransferase
VLFEQAYEHDVFLSPSVTAADGDTEGGAPVTILEMAATGMPVVSTRHCDIPAVLPDGLLADERDVEGLHVLLAELIDAPDDWERRCRAAREHIERDYNAVRQGEALAAIYREVTGAGSSSSS